MNGLARVVSIPMTVTLHLDPEAAELLRRLVRARGSVTPQNALVALLREWDARPDASAERAADEVSYRQRYFQLASDLERTALKVLAAVGQEADNGDKGKKKKRRRK